MVLLLLGVLAIFAVMLGLRHRMETSLAPVDGTLHLDGLSAPVAVVRDARGVPHIEAANVHDLLEAQGWVTASDRLWQMDMARRLPAGEAAEILGAALVDHDRMERILSIRDVAERLVRTMPPQQLEQLEAYSRGVNAYIEHGVLPAEFSLLVYKPRPWRPVDSVLVAISMSEMLDERWQAKLKREDVTARLAAGGNAALAADLYPVGSWRDHPPVPSAPAISDPQEVPQIPLDPSQVRDRPVRPVGDLLRLSAMRDRCNGCNPGSNEWAVAGTRTADGKPLLSNDMHLEHQVPDVWYESDLHAGGFHAAGVSVAGLPFISAGHNDHIAWGFTALGGDTQDLYVETLNAQDQYQALNADGSRHWEPLTHERETIHVRGGANVPLDVVRTAHGPIITPLLASLHTSEQRSVALHWAIYDPAAKGLPLYALNTASDWTSFRAAMATWWAPTLNVVYADDAGHIGYQAVGLIPIRAGGLQSMPIVPGQTQGSPAALDTNSTAPAAGATTGADGQGAAQASAAGLPPPTPPAPSTTAVVGEWTGYIPADAMPSVLDPEGGIVATANSRITPDGYPYQITLDWASPYRNERIWKWLRDKKGLTPADMLKLQTDVFSEVDQELAQRFAYAIDHASHTTARTREAADILRSWDGVLATHSSAAAIVTGAEGRFWPAVLGPKIGDGWRLYDWSESAYAREQMIAHAPAAWLPPGNKTWNDFLAGLVEATLKDAPGNLRSWQYGEKHTIEIQHPLWKAFPFTHSSVGPLPQSGDPTTVKQVLGNLGPSQRFTADMGDLDHSTENIVMGESEDPKSPDYRNQWPSWYGGTTFPLAFSDAAVRGATEHSLRLVP